MMPQSFSFQCPILIVNGLKQSMPVEQNTGWRSLRLEGNKSAILGMLGLPHHFWHSVQWCRIDGIAWRPLKTQKRLTISAKTRSLPGWYSCVAYCLIRSLVTGWIVSRTMRWRKSGLSWWHLLSLPPTLISWLSRIQELISLDAC